MIYSPLEQFEIRTLISINNSSIINISNYVIYLIIIILIISNYSRIIENNNIKSNRWGLSILAIYDTILNMINNQIGGKKGRNYLPLIFTLFNFILIANLISMIPYSYAISAQIIGIITLSLTLWLGLTILGIYTHGINFFSLFVPTGTPLLLIPVLVLIETLSYSSRAISLGLRLSVNILAGHLLMIILGSLILSLMGSSLFGFIFSIIPLIGFIGIVILEFAISCIQAYVFSILLSGYIKDVIYLH